MIEIERGQSYRRCNVCYGKVDVYDITFVYNGTKQGSQIALCKDCVNDLIKKLNAVVSGQEDE